jgi:hypothetical protein
MDKFEDLVPEERAQRGAKAILNTVDGILKSAAAGASSALATVQSG